MVRLEGANVCLVCLSARFVAAVQPMPTPAPRLRSLSPRTGLWPDSVIHRSFQRAVKLLHTIDEEEYQEFVRPRGFPRAQRIARYFSCLPLDSAPALLATRRQSQVKKGEWPVSELTYISREVTEPAYQMLCYYVRCAWGFAPSRRRRRARAQPRGGASCA